MSELNPKYFYQDRAGNYKPYIKCCSCLSGPYKHTDEGVLYLKFGILHYCMKCARLTGLVKWDGQKDIPKASDDN
jgi:hypothetical protein